MWNRYIQTTTIDETLERLNEYQGSARVVNGGTDIIIEIDRKVRKPSVLIDISRVRGLSYIFLEEGWLYIGAGVTHNQAASSEQLRRYAYPLARACWEVGAPQIRNRGTIAGNILTASPANDTITPLVALGARLTLKSMTRGERTIPLEEFIQGVRKTSLEPDELLVEISFPALQRNACGTFLKFGLRRAQAISAVNVAVVLGFEDEQVMNARIALGSVAPTIVRAVEAQQYLMGKSLNETVITRAAELAVQAGQPIDDIRGSAEYRRGLVGTLVKRALHQLRDSTEQEGFPGTPVKLWGKTGGNFPTLTTSWDSKNAGTIETTVNGQRYFVEGATGKTLLRMLREDLGFTGVKEGCAEGECGACTILLDGIAVMSCLVPAPRAHMAEILTIEGLGEGEKLHPLQQSFIDAGAVQCGYCSPGFLMSGVALLDEIPNPSKQDITQAISGNLCRCTGYFKIVEAIEQAAMQQGLSSKNANQHH